MKPNLEWTWKRYRWLRDEKARLDAVDPAFYFDHQHLENLLSKIRQRYGEQATLNTVKGALTRIRDRPGICHPGGVEPWLDDIVQAYRNIGGAGYWADLYDALSAFRPGLTDNFRSTIRNTVQRHSSDSRVWHRLVKADGTHLPDIFWKGEDTGFWGVRSQR